MNINPGDLIPFLNQSGIFRKSDLFEEFFETLLIFILFGMIQKSFNLSHFFIPSQGKRTLLEMYLYWNISSGKILNGHFAMLIRFSDLSHFMWVLIFMFGDNASAQSSDISLNRLFYHSEMTPCVDTDSNLITLI